MSSYFAQDDVSLPGLAAYYKVASDEEREHAIKFINYQIKRGGKVQIECIRAPPTNNWENALKSLEVSLALEKRKSDSHLTKYLEDEFLEEQVQAIKELGDYVTQIKRAGPQGIGRIFI
ncbi:Ferritin heavy chain A [Armadillidium nasatum]|uniref:Ferritin n=1 Tax=Armadillidium nasatum TaxID=96803 RepID=A0A5N5TEY5_9CRUS|nr:Ferritin heavy chain A [Armadillidium nasatum]